MHHRSYWVVFVTYFTFFIKCETRRPQSDNPVPNIVSQLFENKSKPPIILYLTPNSNVLSSEEYQENFRSIQYDEESQEEEQNFIRTAQDDERAYILYHLLRNTIDDENIDPSALRSLQHTQEFLRQALIGRCRKLRNCIEKCLKPKIKKNCPSKCKQVYDDLDECDQPKVEVEEPIEKPTCKIASCGHTMPPDWR